MRDGQLEIHEGPGPGDARSVALRGELDLASVSLVEERLRDLIRSGRSIRLELSELDFIDCTGMRALLNAQADAEADGERLEIDGELTPPVRRMFTLLAEELLPGGLPGGRVARTGARTRAG